MSFGLPMSDDDKPKELTREQRLLIVANTPALYPAPLLTTENSGKWHMCVFGYVLDCWDVQMQGTVHISDYPVFSNRKDRALFMRWFTRYKTWFNRPVHKVVVPEPPQGQIAQASAILSAPHEYFDRNYKQIVGRESFSEHDSRSLNSDDKNITRFAREWAWLTAHCKGPVYRLHGGWLFARATDAVTHKLFRERREEQDAA